MTNKNYKRLTPRNSVVTGRFSGKTLLHRLTALENAIENRTLVFLPYKVGDEFWCIAECYSLSGGWENVIAKHTVHEVRILNNVIYLYDENDDEYDTSDVILYTTKKAAEKALRS